MYRLNSKLFQSQATFLGKKPTKESVQFYKQAFEYKWELLRLLLSYPTIIIAQKKKRLDWQLGIDITLSYLLDVVAYTTALKMVFTYI